MHKETGTTLTLINPNFSHSQFRDVDCQRKRKNKKGKTISNPKLERKVKLTHPTGSVTYACSEEKNIRESNLAIRNKSTFLDLEINSTQISQLSRIYRGMNIKEKGNV
jgi:hypothetical protein